MKRFISVILIISLLAGILISCGNNNTAVDTDTETKTTTDPEVAQDGEQPDEKIDESKKTEVRIEPELPEIKFDGYTFTFLAHSDGGDDWVGLNPLELVAEMQDGKEVQNSDPINDAVYTRNLKIKEKYNINIEMIPNTNEGSVMKKSVASGDTTYDAVIMFNNNVQGIVTGDLLTNVSELPYIDLSKPWWDPAVNSMSIDNKNFLLAGDLLILDNEATNALLFNKNLMKTLNLELPYGMVNDGKWTMDVFNEYIKSGSADINGDGVMKPKEDRWGFVAFNDTLHALLVAGGGALALKDDNDLPYMSFTEPRNLSVIDKLMGIMFNKEDVLNVMSDTPLAEWSAIFWGAFEEDRALFQWVRLRVVEKYRGMESPFGIIPLPKFDENQDKYYSCVNPYTGVLLGVPKSADDLERVSIILEALSAESRYTLQPAYYDVTLQRKYARDNESEEMLDIIFKSRIYDIGAVYSFGNVFAGFGDMCYKSDTNIMSYYDKNIGKMEKAINKVIGTFQGMD